MGMLSEQINKIRKVAKSVSSATDKEVSDDISRILNEAADTIESLSAKLQAENMERSAANYAKKNIIERIKKESIGKLPDKRPFIYLNTVIEIISDNDDNWFPGYYRNNWILCENKMPKEYKYPLIGQQSFSVLTTIEYENKTKETLVQCTINGKWNTDYQPNIKCKVLAWQPLPEPYRP